MAAKVVTANRLNDGAVVYLAPEGRWSECLEDSLVGQPEDVAAMMAMAERAVVDRMVVTPYEIDVDGEGADLRPCHIKEVIRAAGPTVRMDLGKQAWSACAPR